MDENKYNKLSNYLSEQGIPNECNEVILKYVDDLIKANKPSMSILNLQIMHDALVSRLVPYMALGEKTVVETLSRLLRYIQQLETTNASLRQGIIDGD